MQHLSYASDKKIQNYQLSFRSKLDKCEQGTVNAGKTLMIIVLLIQRQLTSNYYFLIIPINLWFKIMKKQNSHFVKLIDILQSAINTYITTQFCNGGDLREFIKPKGFISKRIRVIPQEEALKFLKDFLQGIKALLKQGIIHNHTQRNGLAPFIGNIQDSQQNQNSSNYSQRTKLGSPIQLYFYFKQHISKDGCYNNGENQKVFKINQILNRNNQLNT